MPELASDFQSLTPEYQELIRLAQDQHRITITPLQKLVGGWSGAIVYLVSVSANSSKRVEHLILKLDRQGKSSKSDEVTRHSRAMSESPPDFARDHIARLAFERLEHEGAIAILYGIAGQSLREYRPLSSYQRQSQLRTIFAATNTLLLAEWNANAGFEQAVHPQQLLENWLGFRLEAGGSIERFFHDVCKVTAEITGLLFNGNVFHNPLAYARNAEFWGTIRPMDVMLGFIHGDLNTNNILVKFSAGDETLEGYYLIDFALFKEGMPLLYDQRYLEMSYLIHSMSQVSFEKCVELITRLAEANILDPHHAPIEMAGVAAVISSARNEFAEWVRREHPSLYDDLWAQYWLAGVAAGLTYCHKPAASNEQRLAGLIYAAANLKRYAATFGLPPPTDVALLYDENRSGADIPGATNVVRPKHNLPAQPTAFIGRTAQTNAVKELLLRQDVHLVTLMGPGGTGKTRLSLQVAQELLENFPDGVYFIPLSDDTDANQFISRVAQQLGVREGGRPLLENVKDYLRDKRLLLVLDNFEQLVSAATVVAELLAAALRVKIITSSRVALKLHGEHEFPVPPMDLPQMTGELSMEDLSGNESVFLFVERARAAQPSFTLTRDNALAITEICRRLDGLPLALELAAARVKLLPPQAILARLDDRFKLLTGGARDLPARQQTLRNTLEWSFSLLGQDEKTLFARLSIFVGGFTLEAVEAICNPEGQLDILEDLTSLANNSLLRQDETGDGDPRFGMLETIRAYALERLTESGEMDTLRERHAQHFGNIVVEQTWTQLTSTNALRWLNWLEREYDNIRATLAWCLSAPQGIELGAEIVFALEWFWYRRGYLMEGRMWCERVLASPSLKMTSPERALALLSSGVMALWQGKQDTGLAELQEASALGHRHEDEFMITIANLQMAVTFINMGMDSKAKPLLAQAQEYFNEQHDSFFLAVTNIHFGNVELGLGNLEQARALHEEALTQARAIGESWILSFALNNLGEVARTQGQYDLARKYYEECEALLRETGDTGDIARFVHNLGYIAQHEGDYARAESQFRRSLTMFRQLGNRRGMAECMAGLAGLKARQGNVEWGAIMLSAAESVLKVTGGAWWPADRVEVEQNREFIRAALTDHEFAQAWQRGGAMTIDQAIHFASNESGTL